MPFFRFCTNPVEALRGAVGTFVIFNLHSIFVSPASKPDNVTDSPLPQMIAAPISHSFKGEDSQTVRTQLPNEADL